MLLLFSVCTETQTRARGGKEVHIEREEHQEQKLKSSDTSSQVSSDMYLACATSLGHSVDLFVLLVTWRQFGDCLGKDPTTCARALKLKSESCNEHQPSQNDGRLICGMPTWESPSTRGTREETCFPKRRTARGKFFYKIRQRADAMVAFRNAVGLAPHGHQNTRQVVLVDTKGRAQSCGRCRPPETSALPHLHGGIGCEGAEKESHDE